MPKLLQPLPRYRRHASGRAVVCWCGQDFYLGPFGSTGSHREYDRRVGEWLAGGRQLPVTPEQQSQLTIIELLARYWRFAKQHYRKNGQPTREQHNIRYLKPRWAVRDLPAFKGFKLQGAEVAGEKTPWGWTAEFKLPWTNFPEFKAKAGEIIGIDCELCSSDGGPRAYRTFVYSSPANVATPSAFGRVRFVEQIDLGDHFAKLNHEPHIPVPTEQLPVSAAVFPTGTEL